MKAKLFPILYLLSLVSSTFLTFQLPGPDNEHSILDIASSLLMFGLWTISLYCFGRVIVHKLGISKSPQVFSFFFGSLGMAVAGYLFSFLGLLDEKFRGLYILFLAVGPLLFQIYRLPNPIGNIRTSALSCIVLSVLFLPRLVMTFLPASFWDALWYHLPISQSWWMNGSYKLPLDSIAQLCGGHWDSLYLWPHLLLGSKDGGGQVLIQLFAQWQHLFLGFLGSVFVFTQIARVLFGKKYALLLASTATLSVVLLSFASIAKNDWGIIFWWGALLLFFLRHRSLTLQSLLILGIGIGWTLSSKWSGLFFLAAFLPTIFLLAKNLSPKNASILGVFLVFGALPIMIRNYWTVGNPIFPLGIQILPETMVGPTWRAALLKLVAQPEITFFAQVQEKIRALYLHNQLIFLWVLLPVEWILLHKSMRAKWLRLIAFFPLILFFFATPRGSEPRHLGALLMLTNLLGLGMLLNLLKFQIKESLLKPSTYTLCLIAIIVIGTIWDWASIKSFSLSRPELEIRKHISGTSLAWIRLNVPKEEKIVSISEGRLYYLGGTHKIVRVWDSPDLDQKIVNAGNLLERVRILRDEGFSYMIHGATVIDEFFNLAIVNEFKSAAARNPEVLVHRSNLSGVIDLVKLERVLASSN